jgi:hypothetical protein
MDSEDPALPEAEIDECEAVIAGLGDDAALLRHDNPDCEIAANMDAAADMLEKMRRALHVMTDEQKPVAWMWQHEETGRTGFVDEWQVAVGWAPQNPRLKLVTPLYDKAAIAAAVAAERERCALVCESLFDADDDSCNEAEKCAAAIRQAPAE